VNEKLAQIAKDILAGKIIDRSEIEYLFSLDKGLPDLLYWANEIRAKFFGRKIKICSIVPARLGGCNQDCKFCAQSARYETSFKETKSLTDEEIIESEKQEEYMKSLSNSSDINLKKQIFSTSIAFFSNMLVTFFFIKSFFTKRFTFSLW
jgi:biotin synthase-like enzyme